MYPRGTPVRRDITVQRKILNLISGLDSDEELGLLCHHTSYLGDCSGWLWVLHPPWPFLSVSLSARVHGYRSAEGWGCTGWHVRAIGSQGCSPGLERSASPEFCSSPNAVLSHPVTALAFLGMCTEERLAVANPVSACFPMAVVSVCYAAQQDGQSECLLIVSSLPEFVFLCFL